MARPKARPKGGRDAEPPQPGRVTIINLKGSAEQAEWLETIHKRTHIAKSVIVRLALDCWAEKNGHPRFPMSGDDE